jgi:quercetin dioxygenase-like cupin family protein
MASIDRPLGGDAILFRLSDGERSALVDDQLLAERKRTARTLVKEGALRVTLVALSPGGSLAEHHAEGPITVHVLAGEIRFRTGEKEWNLSKGDLLALPARVPHAVESDNGGEFLLTVAVTPPAA